MSTEYGLCSRFASEMTRHVNTLCGKNQTPVKKPGFKSVKKSDKTRGDYHDLTMSLACSHKEQRAKKIAR